MKTLSLNLKQEFFDQIKSGTKNEEYRLRNRYWINRLSNKNYDQVEIKLGYPSKKDTKRIMVFECDGIAVKSITHEEFGGKAEVYAIRLGKRIS